MEPAAAPPRRIRAFVALEIGDDLRARIAELMHDLRRQVPGVKWASPESLHLTLRFLGHSDPEVLARLRGPLAEAAASCATAEARVSGLGLFPERGSPRVLWLGLHLPTTILQLQQRCERAVIDAGFEPESRAFRPHLTLGRWGERARRPQLPAADLGRTTLERLVLFRSELRRTGAVHTPLAAFALGGEAADRR